MAKIISIILPDLRVGGAEKVTVNLAKYLSERGYVVHLVLLSEEGELLGAVPDSIKVINLEVKRLRNLFFPLRRYLIAHQPDAVLACMWPITSISVLAKYAAFLKCRLVAAEHTTWGQVLNQSTLMKRLVVISTMRLTFPFVDKVVTVSNSSRNDLIKLLGVKSHQFQTIYNPVVDCKRVSRINSVREDGVESLWSSGGHYKLLSVGTLKKVKDYKTLLVALSMVLKQRDAHLLILGEGEERSSLEKIAKDLNINNNVHMPGFVANVEDYYEIADLLVLSSTTEGLPTVIIEALAAQTPVVSTDCPSGPREILGNTQGELGFLSSVGDAKALAENIIQASENDFDANALLKRANDFSIEKCSEQYIDVLFRNSNLS